MNEPTHEQVEEAMEALLEKMTPAQIMIIPGIYEILYEELINDVLQRIKEAQEEEDEE